MSKPARRLSMSVLVACLTLTGGPMLGNSSDAVRWGPARDCRLPGLQLHLAGTLQMVAGIG